jgi:hypothetical protein
LTWGCILPPCKLQQSQQQIYSFALERGKCLLQSVDYSYSLLHRDRKKLVCWHK